MKIGYARVSTRDQDLALQLDALEKIGCEKTYQEKRTGSGRFVIGPLSIVVGVVVMPVLLVLGLWADRRLFPAGQFHFGPGRKAKRDGDERQRCLKSDGHALCSRDR